MQRSGLIQMLQKIDRGLGAAERGLLVGVLILMVLVAGFAAGVRNLTRFDIAWANTLLMDMEWADSLLRKGTLWLAFIGASLATQRHKHINIDVLLRMAPPRAKYTMRAVGSVAAAVIAVGLTYAFWQAVHLNLSERPMEYELLAENGSMHVCDATPTQLAEVPELERPGAFCAFRSALKVFGVVVETPGAAFQLIVPLMLLIIALRFLGQGVSHAAVVLGGADAIAEADAIETAERIAQEIAVPSPEAPGRPADESSGAAS